MTEDDKREIVLVVEDSPESLGMLHEVLESSGYTVLLAPDGERALDIVNSIMPDAILMDAVLPGMSGFDTTRKIKENKAADSVPVLFMTGLDDTDHIVEGLELGAVDYIVKPVNPSEMVARLKVHVQNAKNAQSASAALEISGQSLITTDAQGLVTWATHSVSQCFVPGETSLSDQSLNWLKQVSNPSYEQYTGSTIETDQQGHKVQLFFLGKSGEEQYLLRLKEDEASTIHSVIRENFELTAREADVMMWLINGKSNKEIALILDISPRTVNKYLDQAYVKLGVENRTAAAMTVMRRIADHLQS